MADVVAEDQTQQLGREPAPDTVAPAAAPTGSAPAPASAYAGGPPRFPRRYVYLAAYSALGLVLVLVLGAFLLNRFGPTSSTGPSTPSGTLRSANGALPSGSVRPPGSHDLKAPLSKFMDISPMHARTAKGFTLTDAKTGAPVSLASFTGRVVVLTFANAPCNDICPVLATELHRAASLLGRTKVPVAFVTINTDPLETKTKSASPVLGQPQLSSLPDWYFLTGSIHQLNPIWKAYGVAIAVDETTRRVSHNDPMYFISPRGKLEWSAAVFGDETKRGTYTLPSKDLSRYAAGVATYAKKLAGQG